MQETRVWSLGQEDPLEKEMATHSSSLAWKFQGQRSLVGYRTWDCKQLDTSEHSNNKIRDFLYWDLKEQLLFLQVPKVAMDEEQECWVLKTEGEPWGEPQVYHQASEICWPSTGGTLRRKFTVTCSPREMTKETHRYVPVSCCCSVAQSCLFGIPWTAGLQVPCPSPSPRVCSNSCPLSWWCHPTISSSVIPFSSYPQSFPTSGSFPKSWLFMPTKSYQSSLAQGDKRGFRQLAWSLPKHFQIIW